MVVWGRGMLVGDPMYQIFKQHPRIGSVNAIDFNTSDSVRTKLTQEADIIVVRHRTKSGSC